jgi:plastocyanin
MNRRALAPLVVTAVVLLSLAVAPTVLAGDPCYHGYTIPPTTTAATDTVRMDPCAFLPTNAKVAPGTTVTFTNTSSEAHLLFGANAAWGDRDAEIPAGKSVTVTFDKPGVYAFACALHRGMSGAVIVGDVGDPVDAAGAARTGSGSSGPGGLESGTIAMLALGGIAVAGWALALASLAPRVRRRVIA